MREVLEGNNMIDKGLMEVQVVLAKGRKFNSVVCTGFLLNSTKSPITSINNNYSINISL